MTNEKPTFKQELVITKCPNPRALSIQVATPRALDWIIAESAEYTDDSLHFMHDRTLPASGTLVVSPCYDVDEIKTYLEKPDYFAPSLVIKRLNSASQITS